MKRFKTVRFGWLEYDPNDVIHLPDGLVGMPGLRDWLMLEMGDGVPLKWLQSIDRSDFGFPVAEPSLWKDGYQVSLPPDTTSKLGAGRECECVILIITTIHPGGTRVTGNLLAPLAINPDSRLGAQLTLPDETLSVREEIDYLKFGLAVGTAAEDNSVDDPGVPEGHRVTAEEEASEVSLR
jgi:flagellar assembly factor FliW